MTSQNTEPADILLVGTGAVGAYYGGKLTEAGIPVSCIARSDYDIVSRQGVKILSRPQPFRFLPQAVYRQAGEVPRPPDYILICLKALPEIDLFEMLKAAVSPETALVTIQNGIDNEATVAERFPDNQIIGGIAYVAASRIEPGVVQHLGSGTLTLGSHPKGISAKTRQLAERFTAAGVPTRTTEEIASQRWLKMMWNATFNPISVLGGKADSQRMLADEESTRLVRKVMGEVQRIAEQVGCVIPADAIDKIIDGTLKLDAFKTSMLVDFEAGRAMETEAILGRAVRLAREKGLSVPYLETLYALLKMHAPV